MKKKLIWAAVILVILAIPFGWWGARRFYYRGYSTGSRTGVLRKLSVKGHPGCRYLAAELALQGAQPGQNVEIWEFSVDDDRPENPIVQKLKAAEKAGNRVTVEYRQDLSNKDKLWVCEGQPEYYVTAVE